MDLQLFNREAEQAESWMGKREAFLASEDVGTSLDTVEALIRKYEDIDKSLQAQVRRERGRGGGVCSWCSVVIPCFHSSMSPFFPVSMLPFQEEKIVALQGFADRLIQTRHYAAVEVAERRASILARWSQLKALLVEWRSRLGQSYSLQQFRREADEAEGWMAEKMQVACDDSYKDPTNLPGKLQKHQAFEAEVVANKDRIFTTIAMGQSRSLILSVLVVCLSCLSCLITLPGRLRL